MSDRHALADYLADAGWESLDGEGYSWRDGVTGRRFQVAQAIAMQERRDGSAHEDERDKREHLVTLAAACAVNMGTTGRSSEVAVRAEAIYMALFGKDTKEGCA